MSKLSSEYFLVNWEFDSRSLQNSPYFAFVFPACGEFNTINPGTSVKILSSNYPANYKNNEYCVWAIICPGSTQPLTLNITSFELQQEASCRKDYLVIKDGTSTNSTIMGHICGSLSGLTKTIYTSTTNAIQVNMHTDASIVLRGVEAFVSCPGRCDMAKETLQKRMTISNILFQLKLQHRLQQHLSQVSIYECEKYTIYR